MANTDQLIALAERIAASLHGVSRNEWMRWVQVAQPYGIDKAIRYSQRLAYDTTVRPSQQRAHRIIAKTMQQFQKQINQLQEEEVRRLYGFIAWSLVIQRH